MSPAAAHAYAVDAGRKLAAARDRDDHLAFIGRVEAYCENEHCVARTVTIEVKEYDAKSPARLRCPACGQQLNVHQVLTLDEAKAEDEADARRSVNAQLWRRDHPDVIAMPIGALVDDRLPAFQDSGAG